MRRRRWLAIREVFDEDGVSATGTELPVMISAAVGRGGETLISAQTTEAFWNAVKHVKTAECGVELLAGAGPDAAVPGVSFRVKADVAVSCYPNAGLAESAVGDRDSI